MKLFALAAIKNGRAAAPVARETAGVPGSMVPYVPTISGLVTFKSLLLPPAVGQFDLGNDISDLIDVPHDEKDVVAFART